jgi:hypothetical protein
MLEFVAPSLKGGRAIPGKRIVSQSEAQLSYVDCSSPRTATRARNSGLISSLLRAPGRQLFDRSSKVNYYPGRETRVCLRAIEEASLQRLQLNTPTENARKTIIETAT